MTAASAQGWEVPAVTGVFAAAVTAVTFLFLVTGSRGFLARANLLGTTVHEAGHALMACVTGGGVYQIAITSADSGMTRHWYNSWLSRVLTTAAGYAAPPLAGLGAASLLSRGHAGAVLTITVVVMALILLVTRDVLTLGVVVGLGFAAFAALYWGPLWLQTWFGYTEAWLLLTSELGGLGHIVVNRVRGGPLSDDAVSMARQTHVPGAVWIAAWFALICWAVAKGAVLLWR
jgi:hypothetical protein